MGVMTMGKVYVSKHFLDRLKERLERCEISFSEVEPDLNRVLSFDYKPKRSYAVKVLDLGKFVGEEALDHWDREESNGEVLWIVVRDLYACTFFLRRRDQPSKAKRFSVDEVL